MALIIHNTVAKLFVNDRLHGHAVDLRDFVKAVNEGIGRDGLSAEAALEGSRLELRDDRVGEGEELAELSR
jgi:hypothetical protein